MRHYTHPIRRWPMSIQDCRVNKGAQIPGNAISFFPNFSPVYLQTHQSSIRISGKFFSDHSCTARRELVATVWPQIAKLQKVAGCNDFNIMASHEYSWDKIVISRSTNLSTRISHVLQSNFSTLTGHLIACLMCTLNTCFSLYLCPT